MEDNQKKILDRIQFYGLVGPIILLCTLFCTLIKGTPKSGYLFLSVLIALPVSWKWRMKSFLASLGLLLLLLASFYPLFIPQERLWQVGASFSLSLGLLTTFLGFEEIRNVLQNLTIESQSRLENLIDLDEQYNKAQESWKYERAELKNELENKMELLKREREEILSLEKMSATLKEELQEQQSENARWLEELETQAQKISALEQKNLRAKEQVNVVEYKLSQNTSERESRALIENEHLKEKVQSKDAEIAQLLEKIKESEQLNLKREEEIQQKEDAFKSLQEALRQKAGAIQQVHEKILLKDQDLNKQQQEIKELLQAVSQKEHENLTIKSGLTERDYQIQKLNQSLRDLHQDQAQIKALFEEKKLEIKNLKLSSEQEVSKWSQACKAYEVQLKHLSEELASGRVALEKKEAQLTALVQDKERLKKEYHAKEESLEKMRIKEEEQKQKQFQELKKLNETRFALFQASLDKERLQKEEKKVMTPKPVKHWLPQVEQLLKGGVGAMKKVDLSLFPKDLSNELLGLNQTKALYKQLRNQFDEKNEILEEARAQLYQAETKIEELHKEAESYAEKGSKAEQFLEKDLLEKTEELNYMEKEMEILNILISDLLKKIDQDTSATSS